MATIPYPLAVEATLLESAIGLKLTGVEFGAVVDGFPPSFQGIVLVFEDGATEIRIESSGRMTITGSVDSDGEQAHAHHGGQGVY